MTDTSVYNARDSRYKSPYGAVAAGTPVHFTLRPRRAEGFSRGVLTARLEQGRKPGPGMPHALDRHRL